MVQGARAVPPCRFAPRRIGMERVKSKTLLPLELALNSHQGDQLAGSRMRFVGAVIHHGSSLREGQYQATGHYHILEPEEVPPFRRL
ncbi:NADPH-dependent diflavin oxidoreductase 1 [Frankliniella fusca]|uniref:NADPH-dependent diflavin oxidoreductase 1 n=1 Tax=Frankliniella fusca TaxID=407009 RepID=A0AAE1LBN7_9NEOP|nr:NADPH-dependent diflavin oxidoreductase 1 [Frankliniella fusca]